MSFWNKIKISSTWRTFFTIWKIKYSFISPHSLHYMKSVMKFMYKKYPLWGSPKLTNVLHDREIFEIKRYKIKKRYIRNIYGRMRDVEQSFIYVDAKIGNKLGALRRVYICALIYKCPWTKSDLDKKYMLNARTGLYSSLLPYVV